MPEEPITPFIRRGQVFDWLLACGFSDNSIRTLLEKETINPVRLSGLGRNYYSREQIKTDILNEQPPTTDQTGGPASGVTKK